MKKIEIRSIPAKVADTLHPSNVTWLNGIVRGYATVAEKANVKEGTLVEGDTYYIQS